MSFLVKFLAPVTEHRWFIPIATAVCTSAWAVTQVAEPHTWAHSIASGAVGLCSLLGIASPGVYRDAPKPSEKLGDSGAVIGKPV